MPSVQSTPAACASLLIEVLPPLMQTFRQGMRSGRGEGLSVPQFRALAMIDFQPGTSLAEVAAHVGLGSPAMSVIVEGLVRRRLVRRQTSTSDRRRSVLMATSDGRMVLDQARAAARALITERIASLPPEALATIADALTRLGEAFPGPTTHAQVRHP